METVCEGIERRMPYGTAGNCRLLRARANLGASSKGIFNSIPKPLEIAVRLELYAGRRL